MIEKVFTILTEFKFEAVAAVSEADAINSAVQKISGTAQGAMSLVSSFVSSYLAANISLLGLLSSAIYASEGFFKNQLTFANVMSGQLSYLQGPLDSYVDRMIFAKQTLNDIADVAHQFALPEAQLTSRVKGLLPAMINQGTAGDNFKNAINMARMFEKSAPTLGIDPMEAQGQLIRTMTGSASGNDTLFRRLLTETEAFKELRGSKSATQKFNTMDEQKRYQMLSEAMKQFSKDADVVHGMMQLLSNKFQVMKDTLFGIKGVLTPLGDTILPLIRIAFDFLNEQLNTRVRSVVEAITGVLRGFIGTPKTIEEVVDALAPLYVNLKQLASLKSDVKSAGKAAGLMGILATVVWGLEKLGFVAARFVPIIGPLVSAFAVFWTALSNSPLMPFLKGVMTAFLMLGAALTGVGILAYFGKLAIAFQFLGFIVSKVLWPFMLLTAAFQLISRSMAYAAVEDAKHIAKKLDQVGDATKRFSKGLYWLTKPFTDVFDALARYLVPVFSMSPYIDLATWSLTQLADVMEWLGGVIARAMAGFQGLVFAMKQLNVYIDNLWTKLFDFMFGTKKADPVESWGGMMSGIGDAFNAGVDDVAARYYGGNPDQIDKRNVKNNVTNIGKVEIRQDFKENQEPDRIAHSVVRALGNLAKNPTQAAGRSMEGALYGAN